MASNYYPVTTGIALRDSDAELAVLTDVAQGGTSLRSGSLELMVHRRIFRDDNKGVFEALDETMCGCRQSLQHQLLHVSVGCDCASLVVRGRHWLVLGGLEATRAAWRELSEQQNFGPTLAFGRAGKVGFHVVH